MALNATVQTPSSHGAGSIAERCHRAHVAARVLAGAHADVKNRALGGIAAALERERAEILRANERDMEAGAAAQIGDALLDRLCLDGPRLEAIADAVRRIASLADPVGEVIDGWRLPNGLDLRRVRVPIGVIAVVYEARPNVTIDATALCLKSGNAIVLRGSSAARHSNAALAGVAAAAVREAGLPDGSVVSIAGGGREELAELSRQPESVDLIIPRGGEGLKAALQATATVPVIYAASGNCHVYVDRAASLEMAESVVINAKVQRPGVCNAAEKLLVHADIAEAFLPRIVAALRAAGVEVRADARALALLGGEGNAAGALEAEEEDWDTEYLDLRIAVAVVDGTEEALAHIARHGSGHSEAIVTGDAAAARAFQLGVDAACVYVNASTRFTDGGEFGMGAEIGNSTQKLHARGPLGLRELTTYKYLVEGDGHVRG
ncbi:MAG: glutamate-5-semialdehyde dehydrogenase [Acidobacteriota bacterium]|nr:glutamate-5-semialdehyde dehydrogenase [Acidobacteriota bacterium]